jgi:hypothetical protein
MTYPSRLTTKLTRRRKRRVGARHERKAEAVGGRVQRLVVLLSDDYQSLLLTVVQPGCVMTL